MSLQRLIAWPPYIIMITLLLTWVIRNRFAAWKLLKLRRKFHKLKNSYVEHLGDLHTPADKQIEDNLIRITHLEELYLAHIKKTESENMEAKKPL